MKSVISLLLVLGAAQTFAADYGFLNQDINSNSCFVGIDGSTLRSI